MKHQMIVVYNYQVLIQLSMYQFDNFLTNEIVDSNLPSFCTPISVNTFVSKSSASFVTGDMDAAVPSCDDDVKSDPYTNGFPALQSGGIVVDVDVVVVCGVVDVVDV